MRPNVPDNQVTRLGLRLSAGLAVGVVVVSVDVVVVVGVVVVVVDVEDVVEAREPRRNPRKEEEEEEDGEEGQVSAPARSCRKDDAGPLFVSRPLLTAGRLASTADRSDSRPMSNCNSD